MPSVTRVTSPSTGRILVVPGKRRTRSLDILTEYLPTSILPILGIYGCFLTQGILQESIYKTEENVTGGYFKCPIFLVAMVCMSSCVMGILLIIHGERSQSTLARVLKATHRSTTLYLLKQAFLISLTYTSAMCCTNYALTKVNYPTQVLVKSAKAVPVVVGGYLMYGKKYPVSDYLMVVVVTLSLIAFQYANTQKHAETKQSHLIGYFSLAASLIFDGMTGPRQDRLISKLNLSTGEMMFVVNVFAAPLCLLLSLILEGSKPYLILFHHWDVLLPSVIGFVICGSVGQVFVVQVLRGLGSLHVTLVTTSRKFLAILLSVLWFRHPLTAIQWISVTLIFLSALLKYAAKQDRVKFP